MKVLIRNTLFAAAIMLVAASCEKSPAGSQNLSGIPISLSAEEVGYTKALLDEESFGKIGNELQIYDYYTPVTGEAGFYINDQVCSESSGDIWPFVNGYEGSGKYEWTTDGVHKFYGWLAKEVKFDGGENPMTSATFFNNGFTFAEETQTLTIQNKVLGQDTDQYDFMYSNIVSRNLTEQLDLSPVIMEFNHLFTAFKVSAVNNSKYSKIELKSVKIDNFKNKRSVTIAYNGNEPVIAYTNKEIDGSFIFNLDGGKVELSATPTDVSKGEFIIWPHNKEDFKGNGNVERSVKVTIVYDYTEVGSTNPTETVTKVVDLKDLDEWIAGKKYNLNLVFMDKQIIVNCIVMDWIPVEEVIDFSEQLYAPVPLTWEEGTVQNDNKHTGEVILYSDESITAICKFRIDTPRGATWTASLIPIAGHQDAFTIVDGTKYGEVGVDSEIRIKVNNQAPIAPQHACKLRITVQTADGRTIVANIMPDETDPSISEYTIIQNFING